MLQAQDPQLLHMHREARVDHQRLTFVPVGPVQRHKGGETPLHGTYCRDATFRVDIDVHKKLYES